MLEQVKIGVDEIKAMINTPPSGQVNPYIMQQNVPFGMTIPAPGLTGVFPADNSATGHSFTGDGGTIIGVTVALTNVIPTTESATIRACIYSTSGDLPDVLLASSEDVTVTYAANLETLINFVFTGAQQFKTVAGQRYCFLIIRVGGTARPDFLGQMRGTSSDFSNRILFYGDDVWMLATSSVARLFAQVFGV
jgi:hypothetical protein